MEQLSWLCASHNKLLKSHAQLKIQRLLIHQNKHQQNAFTPPLTEPSPPPSSEMCNDRPQSPSLGQGVHLKKLVRYEVGEATDGDMLLTDL